MPSTFLCTRERNKSLSSLTLKTWRFGERKEIWGKVSRANFKHNESREVSAITSAW